MIDTVHSEETDNADFIRIIENPLNIFKNQLILMNGERQSCNKKIFFKRIIRETINFIPNRNLLELMREKLPEKGLLLIYCLEDNLFLKFQDLYIRYFVRNRNLNKRKLIKRKYYRSKIQKYKELRNM